MFSGLVEQTVSVLKLKEKNNLLQIVLERPPSFNSLKEGESICVDGLCLTLESFDKKTMTFTLGSETLKITAWTPEKIKNKKFNLERSMALQSLVGGHIVTGHIDGLARLKRIKKVGGNLLIQVQVPREFKSFFWKKGYIALNGVSLTVNQIKGRILELCLIPKTLEITNLSKAKEGAFLNFEVDYMSRSIVHTIQSFYRIPHRLLYYLVFIFALPIVLFILLYIIYFLFSS